MNAASSVPTRSPRLHSLDALRGLDMLIILGLDALILLLASRNPENGFLQEAARQMTHARWEGLHLYDLVFPVFVFISGASMSFSLAKYTGTSIAPGLFHLWKRAFGLAFLGLLVNGTLTWTESMRYASVLGLIGFSCAIAGTLHPAVPPDGGGCLSSGIHPGPHYPASVHLRQFYAGRLRQLMGGQALAPRPSAWGSF